MKEILKKMLWGSTCLFAAYQFVGAIHAVVMNPLILTGSLASGGVFIGWTALLCGVAFFTGKKFNETDIQFVDKMKKLGKGIKKAGLWIGGKIKGAGLAIWGAVKTVGLWIGGAAKTAGLAVWNGTKTAGLWIGGAAKTAGLAVWSGIEIVGEGIVKGAGKVLNVIPGLNRTSGVDAEQDMVNEPNTINEPVNEPVNEPSKTNEQNIPNKDTREKVVVGPALETKGLGMEC